MKGAVIILICAAIITLGDAQKLYKSNRNYESDEAKHPDNGIVNDDPSLAPVICASEGSNGVLVAHEDCSKFYICTNGRRVTMRCPPNLQYNPIKVQCDWPVNVVCRKSNAETEKEASDDSKEVDVEDDIDNGNDDPSKANEICSAEGSNGVLVAHVYCNRFIKCSNRIRVELRCPASLLFNPRNSKCDWPYNVNCGNRIIPNLETNEVGDSIGNDDSSVDDDKVVNDDPSKAPAICAAKDSEGVLVAHEYCNQFYKCSHGIPVALQCQLNLLYNPKNEQCDWPYNVNCNGRIIPEPDSGNDNDSADDGEVNDDPSKAVEICAAEGSAGVLVAHEYCNQFYKCSHGIPVALQCQWRLLYNPKTEQCDWPQYVDCNGRLS